MINLDIFHNEAVKTVISTGKRDNSVGLVQGINYNSNSYLKYIFYVHKMFNFFLIQFKDYSIRSLMPSVVEGSPLVVTMTPRLKTSEQKGDVVSVSWKTSGS